MHKPLHIVFLALLCGLSEQPATAQSTIELSEMQTIAQATEICALDTTYFVVPEALNDTANSSSLPVYNYINDEGGTFVVIPDYGYFQPSRVNLLTAFNSWRGPYLNYQPAHTQTASTPYDVGSPMDSYGQPYFLFSPLGLLRGDTGTVTLELYADQFDRYTLVSLGQDGIRSTDDVFYQFGGGVTVTALSSLRSAASSVHAASLTAAPGETITVRGVNLGATQSGGKIFWGSQELTNLQSWSDREVVVSLPLNLQGSNPVVLKRNSFTSNGLNLTIQPVVTAAADWVLFE